MWIILQLPPEEQKNGFPAMKITWATNVSRTTLVMRKRREAKRKEQGVQWCEWVERTDAKKRLISKRRGRKTRKISRRNTCRRTKHKMWPKTRAKRRGRIKVTVLHSLCGSVGGGVQTQDVTSAQEDQSPWINGRFNEPVYMYHNGMLRWPHNESCYKNTFRSRQAASHPTRHRSPEMKESHWMRCLIKTVAVTGGILRPDFFTWAFWCDERCEEKMWGERNQEKTFAERFFLAQRHLKTLFWWRRLSWITCQSAATAPESTLMSCRSHLGM